MPSGPKILWNDVGIKKKSQNIQRRLLARFCSTFSISKILPKTALDIRYYRTCQDYLGASLKTYRGEQKGFTRLA